ncbi:MAG: acetate--CoA ligase family protein [Ignavibacteriales bacterium]|nr:acetate--CoA ligase family protein [Ignavibacteriales bacterium]
MPDTKHNLEQIFYPTSVAIVGATKAPGTVPYDIVMSILKSDFQGVVYPVSPKEKFIAGVKAYKYVVDIEDPVDLAILVFPSSVCHMALEQCGKKGIKAAVIISAGFKEVGPEGLAREQQLMDIAKKYGISFIGPNCLGVINTDPTSMLNASFARKMPEEGSIGFLSQSGALCTAVLDYAQAKHIGFSKFVSFGNKADISEIDLLYYLGEDPKTRVILLYLEEISDGRALMDAAADVIRKYGKPILAIKSGRTKEGASAAASHTGSLAGSDDIVDAAFRQAGILRCNNIEEMFNKAIALTYQPLPRGNRVAIITNAGGPGVLTTDSAIHEGLTLAKFSEATTEIFRKNLPKTANIKNPVDVIGDAKADRYNIAISEAMKDDNVDGAFVILTPQSMTDINTIASEVVSVSHQSDKPIYASFMGAADVASGIDILQRNKIPHYILPESMCKAFASACHFREQLQERTDGVEDYPHADRKKAHTILNSAIENKRSYLPESEAVNVLKAYGLPVLENAVVHSKTEAAKFAAEIGYPVVMKVISDDIVHKFDVKGVMLNIQSPQEAEAAYTSIMENVAGLKPEARIQGIMVTRQISQGEEVILGMKRDPSFGAVIMFGFGGIFVEVFKDVAFRVAPIDGITAYRLIDDTKASRLLKGARGRTKRDIASIAVCLQRLSQLAVECPQIKELDINPLIVLEEGKGCFVADAKIML